MNENHEAWKQRQADGAQPRGMTLEHAAHAFGSHSVAAVRSRAKRHGIAYAARKLREGGIGLGMARLLLLEHV